MSIEFDDVASALHLGPEHEVWCAAFAESAATFEPTRLSSHDLFDFEHSCQWLGLSDEVRNAFAESQSLLLRSTELSRLFWHCHHRLFVAQCSLNEIATWRMLPIDSRARPMFFAMVYLSGLSRVRELHRRHKIPEEVTRKTLADLELWMREYHKVHSCFGLDEIWWPATYFTGRMFALGRLQFEIGTFYLPFHVLRNRATREVIAMPQAGQSFRDDGQFADAQGESDRTDSWTTSLKIDADNIEGYPVSARGAAMRRSIILPREQWDEALRPNDPILIVHIPATGPLDVHAWDESFRQAMDFFPRHFPEHPVTAFATSSWLLDAQLADHLPQSSNVVQFQNRFHLLPQPGANDLQTMQRVFGFGPLPASMDDLPRDTSLRRAVIEHIRRGGQWRMGAGYILPDEIG